MTMSPQRSSFLREAMNRAVSKAIPRERIILDPGIGFGKSFDHNLELLKELAVPVPRGAYSCRKLSKGFYRSNSDKKFTRGHGTMATVARPS